MLQDSRPHIQGIGIFISMSAYPTLLCWAVKYVVPQVKEYGARAFKFYNVRYDFGEPFPWRMDDPRVAYPLYEKARELGFNLIAVHKGVPLGPQPLEGTQVWDIDQAVASFPDLNFMIFHPGLPFIDEICWQIIRFPNIYVSLAAAINFIVRAPRWFAEVLGKLLFWGGPDRILTGSEVPLFHPQWALKAFWEFRCPPRPDRRLWLPSAHP